MNKEDYVSLEVAQLLKDKNLSIAGYSAYRLKEDARNIINGFFYKKGDISYFEITNGTKVKTIEAPSLYDAQKWLRNQYGIYIFVIPSFSGKPSTKMVVRGYIINDESFEELFVKFDYNSYEEALNEGIKEALKYIYNYE